MTRRPAGPPLLDPTPTRRRRGPATVVALVLIGLLVGLLGAPLLLAGLAPTASAHDALTGSTPGDGSTVEAPPASIDLTFSEPPLAIGAEVRVTGPDGQVVNAGDLVLTDTVVSQPLAADLPAGAYAVAWRVTSSDGHPISGELGFTATAGTTGATEPAPGATQEPAQEPAQEPTATPPGDAVEPTDEPTAAVDPPEVSQGTGTQDAGAAAEPSPGAMPWLVLGAVLLAAAIATWWARRRAAARRPD